MARWRKSRPLLAKERAWIGAAVAGLDRDQGYDGAERRVGELGADELGVVDVDVEVFSYSRSRHASEQ